MPISKQLDKKCLDGRCPVGVSRLKEIRLTPKEKRAIFFAIKDQIFQLKKRRFVL